MNTLRFSCWTVLRCRQFSRLLLHNVSVARFGGPGLEGACKIISTATCILTSTVHVVYDVL